MNKATVAETLAKRICRPVKPTDKVICGDRLVSQRGIQMPTSIQTPQPFPTSGVLERNLNLTYSELAERIGKQEGAAYSYVVKSVRMDLVY